MAFAFGNQPAQQQTLGSGFGTTGGSAFTTPTTGGFTFGQPAQQSSLFGTTQQNPPAGGGLFSTQAAAQPTSLFGATTTQPSFFGTPTATTQMSFLGGTSTATAQPSTYLGTPAPVVQPFGSFGTPAAQPAAAPPTFGFGGGTVGQPAQPATAPVSTFSFGTALQQPTTTAAATGFTFGGGAAATTSAPANAFSFGGAPAAAPATNFGFGSNLTSTTTTTTTVPTATLGGLLGAPSTAPSTLATFTGLGGISVPNAASSTLGYATGTGIGKGDARTGKEAIIPTELTQLADELKQHMRSEKIVLAEISKRTDIPVEKVSLEIEELKNTLNNITRLVHHQAHSYDTFVKEMNQVQKDLEMAIECNETPPHLRRELVDTTPFYNRLLERYAKQMKFYEREAARVIEVFKSGCDPEEITARELFATLQSTNDTVMALAAKVQYYHESVTEEITAFRNLQRMILGESKFVEEAPATVSNLTDIYNRMYEKANIYFSPNIEASGITNFLHNQPSPAKGATSPTALTSTPLFSRLVNYHQSSKLNESSSFNYPGGYGSPQSLFQMQGSTILNPQLQSPTGQVNTSLKRSKR